MLSDEDRRILRYLQADPGLTAADLAQRCRISPQSVARRLARAGLAVDDLALEQRLEVTLEPEVLTPSTAPIIVKLRGLHLVLLRGQRLVI